MHKFCKYKSSLRYKNTIFQKLEPINDIVFLKYTSLIGFWPRHSNGCSLVTNERLAPGYCTSPLGYYGHLIAEDVISDWLLYSFASPPAAVVGGGALCVGGHVDGLCGTWIILRYRCKPASEGSRRPGSWCESENFEQRRSSDKFGCWMLAIGRSYSAGELRGAALRATRRADCQQHPLWVFFFVSEHQSPMCTAVSQVTHQLWLQVARLSIDIKPGVETT